MMMPNLSSTAYTTQYLLAEKHRPKVKNSHLLEFLAALLGYGSSAVFSLVLSKLRLNYLNVNIQKTRFVHHFLVKT